MDQASSEFTTGSALWQLSAATRSAFDFREGEGRILKSQSLLVQPSSQIASLTLSLELQRDNTNLSAVGAPFTKTFLIALKMLYPISSMEHGKEHGNTSNHMFRTYHQWWSAYCRLFSRSFHSKMPFHYLLFGPFLVTATVGSVFGDADAEVEVSIQEVS